MSTSLNVNWIFLDIESDELLDVKSLRKARQRLFQMGSFIRAVDFVPSDTGEENRKDLRVNIAETPRTGMLSLGGGYGSEGGIFGTAEVGQNNLLGRAYRVHLKGELGTRDHHIQPNSVLERLGFLGHPHDLTLASTIIDVSDAITEPSVLYITEQILIIDTIDTFGDDAAHP